MGVGGVPSGYPTTQASQHLPGVIPAPNELLTSHLYGEEELGWQLVVVDKKLYLKAKNKKKGQC